MLWIAIFCEEMAEVFLDMVSKSFGNNVAVKDLSLTVPNKKCVVLLGPTGAGKTTTLRLIAGLEKPQEGKVFIDGEDVTLRTPAQRDVAFVFQQYSLYPHYSVYDNLAFPLRAPSRRTNEKEIKKKISEVAALLNIGSKLNNKVTELSGGEMQRVSIGRSLVRSPKIFLMDEPLSSLDAKLREGLRTELKRIQHDLAATILYVTHDQFEAMTLADNIGVLEEGRLVQLGEPQQIYTQPASIYVAQRLGSPRINLLKPEQLKKERVSSETRTVGVRPEDVLLNYSQGAPARVEVIEHRGADMIVVLELGEDKVYSLVHSSEDIKKGQEMTIGFRNILSFDEKGQRIAS